jgi:UV excision repair protein RAD23
MEAMGFARAEIDRAMRAAYYNPDRAVDYLLNGIPESVQAQQRQNEAARANPEGGAGGEGQGAGAGAQATSPPTTSGAAAATTTADEPVNLFEAAAQAGGRGGAGGGAGAGARAGAGAGLTGAPANLDFLRNSPQFQQLRQLVQQQPAMLEPVLQQVADGNPQLAQMIGQNQEQFLQLLSEVSLLQSSPAPYPSLPTLYHHSH